MTTPQGLSIADVGRYLKGLGLDIGEHPEFGGVGGGHNPKGYHPHGEAIDVRDWRPDVAPEFEGGPKLHWKERTARLRDRARQLGLFNEALGPGDSGHDTHTHLALRGRKPITQQQLQFLGTGRWQGPDGAFLTTAPGAGGTAASATAASSTATGGTATATPAATVAPAGASDDGAWAAAFDLSLAAANTPLTEPLMPQPLLQSAATELEVRPKVAPEQQRRTADPLKVLEMLGVL